MPRRTVRRLTASRAASTSPGQSRRVCSSESRDSSRPDVVVTTCSLPRMEDTYCPVRPRVSVTSGHRGRRKRGAHMFTVVGDINWIALAIAAAASIVLAGVWFAVVIAKPYAVSLGREGQAPPPATAVSAAGPIVCQLVTLVTSAVLIEALDVTRVADAIAFGLVVGV